VNSQDWLAERFELHRGRLRAVGYRMLGSPSEADDAVQEAWLRLARCDPAGIDDLGAWLTTVVARICLDLLRAREARREQPLAGPAAEADSAADEPEPADEAVLADAVGPALLVVLDTLAPAERLVFVLHDIFAVPFAEIAPIVGRSPDAAKMLASRARRRVLGATVADPDRARQRDVVAAFLAAARDGDFDALLDLLDPAATVRADAAAAPAGAPVLVRGARAVARQALLFSARARHARLATVDGAPGILVGPPGDPQIVMTFAVAGRRIQHIDVLRDATWLRTLDIAVP
jgi:RNA polymerase sigma factor (sigma-70 family)